MARRSVRIPSGLNEEGHFISTPFISLSLRQLGALLGGLFFWWLGAEVVNNVLPGLVAWIVCSPAVVFGVMLAFVKRGGRPIDDWIGDWIRFRRESRSYTLREGSEIDDELRRGDDRA